MSSLEPRRSATMGALSTAGRRRRVHDPSTQRANVSWDSTSKSPSFSSDLFLHPSDLRARRKVRGADESFVKTTERNETIATTTTTTTSKSNNTDIITEPYISRSHSRRKSNNNNNNDRFLQSSAIENALSASQSTPALKSCLSVESQGESLEQRWSKKHTDSHTTTTTPLRKNVSFTSIEIREHPIVVGDNPSVSRGPPVSLDWYDERTCHTRKVSLNEYENTRPFARRDELALSSNLRESLLRDLAGASTSDLRRATVEVNRVKNQRRQTVSKMKSQGKLGEQKELAMEKARNKFQRFVGTRKSTKQAQEELWENAAEYAKAQQEEEDRAALVSPMRSKTMPSFLDTTMRPIVEDKANEEWQPSVHAGDD